MTAAVLLAPTVAVPEPAPAVEDPPPTACRTLTDDDLSFAAPLLAESYPDSLGDRCWLLPSAPGDVLRLVDVGGENGARITDAAGRLVCPPVGFQRSIDCVLSGPPPFTLRERAACCTGYAIQVARINDPLGCGTLPLRGFGQTALPLTPSPIALKASSCTRGTLQAGRHVVRTSRDVSYQLFDDTGSRVCSGFSCVVPATGSYVMVSENGQDNGSSQEPRDSVQVIVPLAGSTPGCDTIGSGWQPDSVVSIAATSRPQVLCHAVDVPTGHDLATSTDPAAPGAGEFELVDEVGDPVCPRPVFIGGPARCRPAADGPVRVLSYPYGRAPREYPAFRLDVGDLDEPTGCPVVVPGAYGNRTEPAPGLACRILAPDDDGQYLLHTDGDADAPVLPAARPDQGPRPTICTADRDACRLTGGARYLLLLPGLIPDARLSLQRLGGPRCGEVEARPESSFVATLEVGAVACTRLPYDSGALLRVVGPPDPGAQVVRVYDRDGVLRCVAREPGSACLNNGPAPHRATVSGAAGNLRMAFARIDRPEGCMPLPAGAYGTRDGVDAVFSEQVLAHCYTTPSVPSTVYAAERTGGAGRLTVDSQALGSRGVDCDFTAEPVGTGTCLTRGTDILVASGGGSSGTFRLVARRLDSDGSCPATPEDALHGAATSGTVTSYVEIDCHDLVTRAGDRLAVDLLADPTLGFEIYGDDPEDDASDPFDSYGHQRLCGTTPFVEAPFAGSPCFLGPRISRRYTVLVRGTTRTAGPMPYELTSFRWADADGYDPSCRGRHQPFERGFGPLVGVLDTRRAVLCVAVARDAGYLLDRGPTWSRTRLIGTDSEFQLPDSRCRDYAALSDCRFLDDRDTAVLLLREQGVAAARYEMTGSCGTQCPTTPPYPITSQVPPRVTGTPAAGRVVTASPGRFAPDPRTPSAAYESYPERNGLGFRWIVDGRPVPGATGPRFAVTPARVGRRLAVEVTAKRSGFADAVVRSPAVTVRQGAVPRPSTRPRLTGSRRAGGVARILHGTWSPRPTSYRYVWTADGRRLSATGPFLRLTPALVGDRVRVTVIAVRDGHAPGLVRLAGFTVGR